MDSEEKVIEEKDLSYQEKDTHLDDSIKMYFKDISKYSLLSPEEEIKYATLVNNPQNKKLLELREKDGCKGYILNIPLLFNSLCDNSSYEDIINAILKSYNELNNNVADGDILYKYLKEANKRNRSLNKEELKNIFNIEIDEKLNNIELLKEVKNYIDYRRGFDKLFVSNLKLVISIAIKFSRKCNINILDLINEGNSALISAINKFDVSLGYKFSTYATWWIRQQIQKYIINNNSFIRLPEYFYKRIMAFKSKIQKWEREKQRNLRPDEIVELVFAEEKDILEKEKKRKLTEKEIVKLHEEKKQMVKEYYDYLLEPVYLDQSLSETEDYSMKDLIASDDNVEKSVLYQSLKEEIEGLLSLLDNPRQELVLKMRFGIGEYKDKSYTRAEIGKALNVSPQWVEQIELKALKRIRTLVRRRDEQYAKYNYLEEYIHNL